MSVEELSYWIAMAGTVAFASSAVLAVAEKKVDLFAAVVLGIITAVGGGTIRDIILDVPVFWSTDLSYIWVAIVASLVTFTTFKFFSTHSVHQLFLYIDAIAVAMFAIQATAKVWDQNFGVPLAPILLGITTSIGGGLIRDVLIARDTLLLSRDLYAVPITIGCVLFTLVLAYADEFRFHGAVACILVTFGIRAGAIRFDWRIPDWATLGYNRRSLSELIHVGKKKSDRTGEPEVHQKQQFEEHETMNTESE
jgi:uncharacterized membrane protein YeiH